MSALGRAATWIAVAALGTNAVLLGVVGVMASRPLLLLGAAASVAAAVVVLVAWRRHLRLLQTMAADRQALRDEALALRDLVRRPPA